MSHLRTYVEMTSPEELVPGREVDDVKLTPIDDDHELIKDLERRIGAPYGWKSATRPDEEWTGILADPLRRRWAVRHHGEPVGLVELAPRADPGDGRSETEVEIVTFGLVPEVVGQGLGGHALTLGLRQAWSLHDDVRRVWLHTSTQDHPNALRNYQARGLRPYRTEERP
ncbi:GNAT family N-acetyltransferase [Cryptosporangium aurantiacum]|uniref:Acetyltransferase (GNAT) family protein n=1 Tax=Cryptosporangium aurantiacum TaxID=134849 RepID=A0A1M7NL96_9ACTN|nr:GNAT family N-acetyltransferase [Cryptosporangium aurantiacum]SHN04509.1 Acetyltransferase (GNAT) family protein [Cryptosporangium aurantiacum]